MTNKLYNDNSKDNIVKNKSKLENYQKDNSFKNLIINKIFNYIDINESINKIFKLDSVIFIILTIIKLWLIKLIPNLNTLIFKNKSASIKILLSYNINGYTANNNLEYESLVYKSLLFYCQKNNINGLKYSSNNFGEIIFFETNNELLISNSLYINTNLVNNNNNNTYEIEIYSYNKNQKYINNFIKKCIKKYNYNLDLNENKINNNKSIINMKYYKYSNYNHVLGQTYFEEYKFNSNKNFKNIFFKNKKQFIKKIDFFINNRSWYKRIGIPYSFGICIYGPTGTGKTSCIKAIANYTQRSIIDISLGKIKTYKELKSIFLDSKINGNDIPHNKKIFIIEDIDCILDVIKSRDVDVNINKKNNLSIPANNIASITNLNNGYNNGDYEFHLDDLLSLLDGILEGDGYIIIITTNHIEKIDKALLRPGRIDLITLFDNSSPPIINEIINHFFPNSKLNKIQQQNFINEITKYCYHNNKLLWSPAKITQLCMENINNKYYIDNIKKYLISNYELTCKNL